MARGVLRAKVGAAIVIHVLDEQLDHLPVAEREMVLEILLREVQTRAARVRGKK